MCIFELLYDNSRLYTSREYDRKIRLYYLRARYYDSVIGRFISRDPIGQVDDVNLYAYVGNNGVMFVDLMGTDKISAFLAKNEGNAWYFESGNNFTTGHAALYFINGGEEYLMSFYPDISEVSDYQIFYRSIPSKNTNSINYETALKKFRNYAKEGDEDYNVIEFGSKNINTSKLSKWHKNELNNLPEYNSYIRNCSDEVEKALDSAGFFSISEPFGISNPFLPFNISLPGTTPGGLGYDIKLELFYKNLLN